jgi:ribosomal protein L37AE/L43A
MDKILKGYLDRIMSRIEAPPQTETLRARIGKILCELVEEKFTSTNSEGDEICPECEAEYPHLLKDGRWVCEECGHSWGGQTSHI